MHQQTCTPRDQFEEHKYSGPFAKLLHTHYNNSTSMKKTASFTRAAVAKTSTPSPQPLNLHVDFPTSPQLILGEELIHFSHPQHPLVQVNLPDLFTCAACKEYGAGKRYTCPQCDFQLHHFCALAPPALKSHPFHAQHKLLFYAKPGKNGILKSRCDICAKPSKGCAFRCTACSFQMHPCCALLSPELEVATHPHPLKLLPAFNPATDYDYLCGECKRKRSGRAYHCSICDYHLHAMCAKNFINGLQDNGLKGIDKPSMLGTAARVASQVVVDFLGGLIEGLGEGVGQALLTPRTLMLYFLVSCSNQHPSKFLI